MSLQHSPAGESRQPILLGLAGWRTSRGLSGAGTSHVGYNPGFPGWPPADDHRRPFWQFYRRPRDLETPLLLDGETFVVGGDDLYAAACELAEQVGIDLEDG